ncbi:MAG: pyridoxamine 5'-phosphate oxidase family protein [Pseudomonadales bacterium]
MGNPVDIFRENWDKAKSLKDANASFCSLATVSATGQASVRILVLREVSENAFTIFINDTSPKWQDMQDSSQPELLVFWPSLMQQYRIRGDVSEVPIDTMRAHWGQKPYETKILDHFYAGYQSQSGAIKSRQTMLDGIRRLKARYPTDADVPFPGNAKGVSIRASSIEVWHGSDTDRLHHRDLYLLGGDVWERHTLVP